MMDYIFTLLLSVEPIVLFFMTVMLGLLAFVALAVIYEKLRTYIINTIKKYKIKKEKFRRMAQYQH